MTEVYPRTFQLLTTSAEDDAASKGCFVAYPKNNQLQIDIDSKDAMAEFQRRLVDVDFKNTPYGEPRLAIKESKSGKGHYHVTLSFKASVQFTDAERIALQAGLGDDPLRTFLNVVRWTHGTPQPSRLFEPLP